MPDDQSLIANVKKIPTKDVEKVLRKCCNEETSRSCHLTSALATLPQNLVENAQNMHITCMLQAFVLVNISTYRGHLPELIIHLASAQVPASKCQGMQSRG